MQRSSLLLAGVLLLTLGSGSGYAAAPGVDLTGKWVCHVKFFLGSGDPTFDLKQSGDRLTGIYHGRFGVGTVTGSVRDRQVNFTVVNDDGTALYHGQLNSDPALGDRIDGSAKYPRPLGTGRFEARRSNSPHPH